MIRNLTRQTILAESPKTALAFRDRLQGMICRDFNGFDAMIFPNCSAIHTWFMHMSIDVLFLNKDNKVLRAESAVKPWIFCLAAPGSVFVIELPAGTLMKTQTQAGDSLEF